MDRLTVSFALLVAFALVLVGLLASWARPAVDTPHLVSMRDSALAMDQAASTMQAHGQAMREAGLRAGDQALLDEGEHWLRDGEALGQGAGWMAKNPAAVASLLTPPSQLSQQAAWGDLTETSAAMLHDPAKARTAVDLQALRWNGQAMAAEGRTMAEHGRVMAEQVDLMVARHRPTDDVLADLRQSTRTAVTVGGHLEQNGQAMIDYADRLRQSLGYR